jgi:hypothetical protein
MRLDLEKLLATLTTKKQRLSWSFGFNLIMVNSSWIIDKIIGQTTRKDTNSLKFEFAICE